MTKLFDATSDALDRLGDLDNDIWSRDEIGLYVQDQYDQFCRRTKALFDVVVIENTPPVGNWQTDLERYFALQMPGLAVSDGPFHMTDDSEQGLTAGGQIGGTYRGPAGITNPTQKASVDDVDSVPTTVVGGYLPQSTVEVLRVTYDNRDLIGTDSPRMRKLDSNYETRSGDPQFFTYDKDGLFFLRVVPAAQGGATYPTLNGAFGTIKYHVDDDGSTLMEDIITQEVDGTMTGGFGILRYRATTDGNTFSSGGPWGTPTQIHPSAENIKVEVIRLGRNLATHPIELPDAYTKYVIFGAMSRALRRDGPGQDLALADHYEQRFEMGVDRMVKKLNKMQPERVGRFGGSGTSEPFGLGLPLMPSAYENPWR